MPADREALERAVRDHVAAGRIDAAAEAAIRGYGPEIYGFLLAKHRDEPEAEEVFAAWSERLWVGLPRFAWGCALRTWCYTVARNCSVDRLREVRRRGRREGPASEALQRAVQEVRSRTQAHLRTEVRSRVAALRETLPPEDRELLTLRIDRQLEWKDLARVVLGEEDPGEEALRREAARLRKRFQLVKERLVTLARQAGLLDREDL